MAKTYRQTELLPDLVELIHLALHLFDRLLPKVMFVRFLKTDSRSFLKWTHAAVADARVCCADVFDQMLWSDQPAHPPARRVEVLAAAAHGEGKIGNLGA